MKHLFVMDPLAVLDPAMDTSLRMAHALMHLGHRCFATTPWEMFWQESMPCAAVHGRELGFFKGPETVTSSDAGVMLLSEFATVHMRKDPPFDMDYITATWLLDTAPATTRIYNSPRGLRTINEKAIILRYPHAIAPALISADAEQLLSFLQQRCAGDAVLKPLTLYSGKGIHRLSLTAQSEQHIRDLLITETQGRSQRLMQPFDQAIYQGEVRAFAIGGEPLAWCLKKPAQGAFMANSSFGSTRHLYQPTERELTLVRSVSQDLQKEGIEIVGFDLIGGNISEINVTSPRLLTAPEDTRDYYQDIAQWLARCSSS